MENCLYIIYFDKITLSASLKSPRLLFEIKHMLKLWEFCLTHNIAELSLS